MAELYLDFSKLKKFHGDPRLLLMPPIPPPMHQMNPRLIKGEAWWTNVRRKAYSRNEGCCWACGVHGERLEAHELYKIDYKKCSMVLEAVPALCNNCHMFIHEGFMITQVRDGKIEQEEFDRIRDHGLKILVRNKLIERYWKRPTYNNLRKNWRKWHIIIDGEKHFSKWSSPEDWAKHFGNTLDKRVL